MSDAMPTCHVPVLLEPLLTALAPTKGQIVIDATFGGGGMTRPFLEAGAAVYAFDQDANAIKRGEKLQADFPNQLTLVHNNFSTMAEEMNARGVEGVDAVIMDLGMSSDQLADEARGFAYKLDAPLDMRMDVARTKLTAAEILNTFPEEKIANIFYQLGDEPKSRVFARHIVAQRKETPFATTQELLTLIEKVYPPKAVQKRAHPALRIFQALRIYINNELDVLHAALPQAAALLKPGGALAVITFHSLEDRAVKKFFKEITEPTRDDIGREIAVSSYRIHTRKITPTAAELEVNNRARSAHLRILERVTL